MGINKETAIILIIGIVFIIGFGILVFFFNPSVTSPLTPVDQDLLIRETSHMTGKQNAKVTLVEFGDYQCPACGQMAPLMEELIQTYGENPNFNFAYRHFPLPQHGNAKIAAEVAETAGVQGKFWEMHNLLYENQAEWSEEPDPLPIFEKYAGQLGLNIQEFTNSINQNTYKGIVQSDADDGRKIPLAHTPTIFINGIEEKNINLNNLKEKIDSLLNS
ncbi:MAG: disulfide bond formation protein DsbA [Parcubacteria group bacterium CG10_big_fil_rev_8_21_14_0_10_38_31]|nr:MAG: disulfide bond formation protein DsbA [Parcubacteria group bacterium CG10_big_fil_rev_8_21_14_0_10_38_31]